MEKKLYRSRSDRMLWGVCGGLAKYFGMDPAVIRIIAVLTIFVNGLGILAYIIMAIVVPLEGSKAAEPKATIKENVEEMKETAEEVGRKVRSTLAEEKEAEDKSRHLSRNILGIILIIFGVIFLLGSFDLFWWFSWGNLWPLIIVAIGVIIILSTTGRRE